MSYIYDKLGIRIQTLPPGWEKKEEKKSVLFRPPPGAKGDPLREILVVGPFNITSTSTIPLSYRVFDRLSYLKDEYRTKNFDLVSVNSITYNPLNGEAKEIRFTHESDNGKIRRWNMMAIKGLRGIAFLFWALDAEFNNLFLQVEQITNSIEFTNTLGPSFEDWEEAWPSFEDWEEA